MGAMVRRLELLPAARFLRAFAQANARLTAAVIAVGVVGGLLVPTFAVMTGLLVRAIRGGGGVGVPLAVILAVFVAGRLLDPVREQLGEALWRQVDESVSQRLMRAMSRPPGLAHVESPEVRDGVTQAEGLVTGVTPGEAGWWLGPVVLGGSARRSTHSLARRRRPRPRRPPCGPRTVGRTTSQRRKVL